MTADTTEGMAVMGAIESLQTRLAKWITIARFNGNLAVAVVGIGGSSLPARRRIFASCARRAIELVDLTASRLLFSRSCASASILWGDRVGREWRRSSGPFRMWDVIREAGRRCGRVSSRMRCWQ